MKRVILDQEKCIGCGACVAISPENFDFDEGISKLISDKVTDKSIEASEVCPVMAIDIVSDECSCRNCQCSSESIECNCETKEDHDECCGHCNCSN